MAFIRKKLDGILATFAKAQTDLDAFITQAKQDIDIIDVESARLGADRALVAYDIERATAMKAKIADLAA